MNEPPPIVDKDLIRELAAQGEVEVQQATNERRGAPGGGGVDTGADGGEVGPLVGGPEGHDGGRRRPAGQPEPDLAVGAHAGAGNQSDTRHCLQRDAAARIGCAARSA